MLLALMFEYLSGQAIFVFTQLIVVDWILLLKTQALTCLLHLDRDLTRTAGRFGVPVTTERLKRRSATDGGTAKMTSLSTHDMVWPEQWCEYLRHAEDVSSRMPGGAERSRAECVETDHAQHFISQRNHPWIGEWGWHPNRPKDSGTDMTAGWVSSSCRTCWNRSPPCRGRSSENWRRGEAWRTRSCLWGNWPCSTFRRRTVVVTRIRSDYVPEMTPFGVPSSPWPRCMPGELQHGGRWTRTRVTDGRTGRIPSVSYALRTKEYRQ